MQLRVPAKAGENNTTTLREKLKMKIGEWTNEESVDSKDVKSPSITFGSNNPKSKDSQSNLQVTGQQIKQGAVASETYQIIEKVDRSAEALSFAFQSFD